jgi:hypothetical protein
MKFKPTNLFYSNIEILKRCMTHKEDLFMFILLWLVFPLIPVMILGWFIAELTFPDNWSK